MPFTFKLSQRLARMRCTALVLTAAALAACEKPIQLTDPGSTAPQLVVSPRVVTLRTNQTVNLMAVGLTATGDTVPLSVSWSVTSGSVTDTSTNGGRHYGQYKASSDTGKVKVIAHGNPGGSTDTAVVTVTAAPVSTVTISPATASVLAGQTAQLVATVLDSAGNVLAGRAVTWASSNATVATVSGTGLATGAAAGTATVTATSEGRTGTTTVTVTNPVTPPGTVADLVVTGVTDTSASLSFTEVTDGAGQPASYEVRYAAGSISWGSATEVSRGSCATPVAGTGIGAKRTCTVLGLSGSTAYQMQLVAFRGTFGAGAVFGGLSNVATATTAAGTPAPVATVTVSPTTASVGVGGTQQFSATLKDASGNVLTGRTVTWSSSALSVATITGSGLVTALLAGSTTITATSEGRTGTGALTVTVLSSGAWPHEPGWATISDWGFDVAPPASSADQPIVGSPGWYVIYNGANGPAGSNVSLLPVAGAPLSPGAVYQFTYKQGFPAGVGPANVYHPVNTSRIYVGFWWRMSNPWTTTTAAQKLLYLMDGASNVVFDMQGNSGTASDPFWTRWVIDGTEYRGDVTYNLKPGVWYRFEIIADLSARTMQWWIYDPLTDGAPVLVGNKSAVAYATGSLNEVQVAPTYGGLGTPAIQDQYFQYDHIHVSGR